jgi:hypothetical protein
LLKYLRYGPNIWMNLIILHRALPPVKYGAPNAVKIKFGSNEENATKISAIDKCSKKKYIRVSFRTRPLLR